MSGLLLTQNIPSQTFQHQISLSQKLKEVESDLITAHVGNFAGVSVYVQSPYEREQKDSVTSLGRGSGQGKHLEPPGKNEPLQIKTMRPP